MGIVEGQAYVLKVLQEVGYGLPLANGKDVLVQSIAGFSCARLARQPRKHIASCSTSAA